ncbi:MAG: HAD-IA family hydrolase [Gammaproteobacteria bacterium]|nr:HAD-IA family hydrolase [Gammaproteobacteria bacterium]
MTELLASNYRTITFDCYGTLIDWESGILGYLQPLLESYGVHVIDDWVLEFFAECEPQIQAEGGTYRSVLGRVLDRFGTRLGFTASEDTLNGFANSIEYWHPFPDTVPALHALSRRFTLGVVSNVDNDLFAFSAEHLGVEFAHVITAQEVGAYKPDKAMFDAALAQSQGPVLHVAQSRFHDIAPANANGLDTVWINRETPSGGSGAARPADVEANWTFTSLTAFAQALNLM